MTIGEEMEAKRGGEGRESGGRAGETRGWGLEGGVAFPLALVGWCAPSVSEAWLPFVGGKSKDSS